MKIKQIYTNKPTYQSIIACPQSTVMKNAKIIKGPNGIGSFRVLRPEASKAREIIAPSTKDNNIFTMY